MEPPIIDLHSDEYFMGEALRMAARAALHEEVPVGAVIVRQGRIIARAHNQVEVLHDATAHAEMLALTQASEALGDWRLNDCTIYVTKEPCPMCAGAMVLSRMARLVFGAGDPKAGGAGGLFNIVSNNALNHRIETKGGVLAEPSAMLLKDFFSTKRKAKADVEP
jgi:tRNA(adenine34) deaminase